LKNFFQKNPGVRTLYPVIPTKFLRRRGGTFNGKVPTGLLLKKRSTRFLWNDPKKESRWLSCCVGEGRIVVPSREKFQGVINPPKDGPPEETLTGPLAGPSNEKKRRLLLRGGERKKHTKK